MQTNHSLGILHCFSIIKLYLRITVELNTNFHLNSLDSLPDVLTATPPTRELKYITGEVPISKETRKR